MHTCTSVHRKYVYCRSFVRVYLRLDSILNDYFWGFTQYLEISVGKSEYFGDLYLDGTKISKWI
jgi:hypothetical protein